MCLPIRSDALRPSIRAPALLTYVNRQLRSSAANPSEIRSRIVSYCWRAASASTRRASTDSSSRSRCVTSRKLQTRPQIVPLASRCGVEWRSYTRPSLKRRMSRAFHLHVAVKLADAAMKSSGSTSWSRTRSASARMSAPGPRSAGNRQSARKRWLRAATRPSRSPTRMPSAVASSVAFSAETVCSNRSRRLPAVGHVPAAADQAPAPCRRRRAGPRRGCAASARCHRAGRRGDRR